MAASNPPELGVPSPRAGGLRWGWILAGVLIASVLISLFLSVLVNGSRPRTGGFVVLLSVVLAGILVGYHSRGETIRESALAGLILVVVTGLISAVALDLAVPLRVWLASPLVIPGLAMLGGWTGELLQGTLEEAHEDRRVDWPWVLVSIVLGFTLSGYAVLVGRELMGIDGHAALWVDRLQPYYAPELELVGVVAAVPPADILGQMERALQSVVDATGNAAAFFGTTAGSPELPPKSIFATRSRRSWLSC